MKAFQVCYLAFVFLGSGTLLQAEDQVATLSWTNTTGKTIQAEFVRLDDEIVVIRKDGKEFSIPTASLSLASQQQARAIAAKAKIESPKKTQSALNKPLTISLPHLALPEADLIKVINAIPLSESNTLKIEIDCEFKKDQNIFPSGAYIFYLTKNAELNAPIESFSGPRGMVAAFCKMNDRLVSEKPLPMKFQKNAKTFSGGPLFGEFLLFSVMRGERPESLVVDGTLSIPVAEVQPPFVAILFYREGEPGKKWIPLSKATWVGSKEITRLHK